MPNAAISKSRARFLLAATTLSSLTAGATLAGAPAAPPAAPVEVHARLETPPRLDDAAGGDADADDPAIWVHPERPDSSIVITTLKNGGLAVHDLRGRELQHLITPPAPGPGDAAGRFNNVDLLYGFPLAGGRADIALVSDRGRDQLRAYRIDPDALDEGDPPLQDVTMTSPPFVFSATQAEVNQQTTAYGLATARFGHLFVAFASRRSRTEVATLVLFPRLDGTVGYLKVSTLELPASFPLPDGGTWTPCQDEDGVTPQVEGMVVDVENRVLYLGQEAVGVWRHELFRPGSQPRLVERVRSYGVPYDRVFDPEEEEYGCELRPHEDPGFGGEHLSPDVEGLTIYYGGGGKGYLLVSSQGDDSFSLFDRGPHNAFVGTFRVADGPHTDSTQESDGAAVINVPLGRRFPRGLLVVQDGDNLPEVPDEAGEPRPNTNFKYIDWGELADAFDGRLIVDPRGWSPR